MGKLLNFSNVKISFIFNEEIKQAEVSVWRLFPAQSLKGRAGNYSLHLEARDAGQPPLSASATFLICVQVTKKI